MMTTGTLLTLFLLPAAATLLFVSLLWVPKLNTPRMAGVIPAFAVTLGFLAGYWVVIGFPVLPPPIDAKSQLPLVAVAALGVSLVAMRPSQNELLKWTTHLALSLVAIYLLARAPIAFQWSTSESIIRVFLLAVGMTLAIESAGSFTRRLAPRASAATLALVAGVNAPAMLFSDSLLLAQLHAALGIAVGSVCVVTWLAPKRVSLAPLSTVTMALVCALWIICLLFASLPILSLALMFLALPLGIVTCQLMSASHARRRAIVSVASVFILVCASVSVAGLRYARTSVLGSPDSGDDTYGYEYDK